MDNKEEKLAKALKPLFDKYKGQTVKADKLSDWEAVNEICSAMQVNGYMPCVTLVGHGYSEPLGGSAEDGKTNAASLYAEHDAKGEVRLRNYVMIKGQKFTM